MHITDTYVLKWLLDMFTLRFNKYINATIIPIPVFTYNMDIFIEIFVTPTPPKLQAVCTYFMCEKLLKI